MCGARLFWLVFAVACLCNSAAICENVDDIDVVHVVFMNHLDVGFDGIDPIIGYAFNVLNKYFDIYFPRAFNTSDYMREHQAEYPNQHYVYTTHPFLLSLYLNCPDPDEWIYPDGGLLPNTPPPDRLHCPNATMVARMRDHILRGDIYWHAFPFNAEAEMYDASLFSAGMELARILADDFGFSPTITMSQRDVPGLTRGAIPLLLQQGVKAITVGVNGASSPPDVPKAFIWRDPKNATSEILAMWHPGGYGGIKISDCVIVDGLRHALAFAFRGDNAGPHTVPEAAQVFSTLQQEFPNSDIRGSTYDAFVRKLETVRSVLPVVTEEIGDTWIYGCPSDPVKVAQFRAVMRARTSCVESGVCRSSDATFRNFDRLLLKLGEHTWGLDVKTFLDDWVNYSNADFHRTKKLESATNYRIMENSWIEQRSFLTNALKALTKDPRYAPLLTQILGEFAELKPSPLKFEHLDVHGFTKVPQSEWSQPFAFGNVVAQLNISAGFLDKVSVGGVEVAAGGNTFLGRYEYHTYTEKEDYLEKFWPDYTYCPSCTWGYKDFTKFNMTAAASPEHLVVLPVLEEVYMSKSKSALLMRARMPEKVVRDYGAPEIVWTNVTFSQSGGEQLAWIELVLLNKTATRLAEAHFFSFAPVQDAPAEWGMSKLGSWINPENVNRNGSNHLHGVDEGGVKLTDATKTIVLRSRDVAVVNPGRPDGFPTPMATHPSLSEGMHFVLVQNIWDTNYIMWFPFVEQDKNLQYRFDVLFQKNDN
eukprot:TRINITY_DN2446_c0_g1_i1.p1 TRINITY_DN2446_c0_g1~~TRINITY_DN2446_c0_g1_i1.p1  ORF type:complete len:760 (-),score=113.06 TRINITY_DN2446_c0_g1_i1:691-2970(-)